MYFYLCSNTLGVWTDTEVPGTGITMRWMVLLHVLCQTLKIYKLLGKKGKQIRTSKRNSNWSNQARVSTAVRTAEHKSQERGSLATWQLKWQWKWNNFQSTHSTSKQQSGIHSSRSLHDKSRLSADTWRNQGELAIGLRGTKAQLQTLQSLTWLS